MPTAAAENLHTTPLDHTLPKRKRAKRSTEVAQSKDKQRSIVMPSPAVQREIAIDSHELAMDPNYCGEISATLAARDKYRGIDERVIDIIIARRGYAYECGYSAQRTGQINTQLIAADVVRKRLECR